jgi:hypothetical protein
MDVVMKRKALKPPFSKKTFTVRFGQNLYNWINEKKSEDTISSAIVFSTK